jgi:phage portal protein BeeE
VTKLEQEFSRSVFTGSNRRLNCDLSGLLRGDPATRFNNWKIAIDTGMVTADEARIEEGFNPRAPA